MALAGRLEHLFTTVHQRAANSIASPFNSLTTKFCRCGPVHIGSFAVALPVLLPAHHCDMTGPISEYWSNDRLLFRQLGKLMSMAALWAWCLPTDAEPRRGRTGGVVMREPMQTVGALQPTGEVRFRREGDRLCVAHATPVMWFARHALERSRANPDIGLSFDGTHVTLHAPNGRWIWKLTGRSRCHQLRSRRRAPRHGRRHLARLKPVRVVSRRRTTRSRTRSKIAVPP